MRKQLFISCFFAFNALLMKAQNAISELPRIIPPAPTTAGLGTYGSLPVDLNAGVVSIGVPLGEIRCRSLSIPVALSYRTTGIRVEEIASWVGLGWNLNPGGLITRTVRGLADESQYGYFATYQRWVTADSMYRVKPSAETQKAKLQVDAEADNGRIDTEPDIYTLSLPGYSATFILDLHHKLYVNPAQNWTISGSSVGSWEVVSPEGVRYLFENAETTEPVSYGDDFIESQPFLSAWHLSSITSANEKDHIWFDYVTNQSGFSQVVPVNRRLQAKIYKIPYSTQSSSPDYCAQDKPFSDGNFISAVNYHNLLSLSRISTETSSVVFTSNLVRPDLDPKTDAPGRRLLSVVFNDVHSPAAIRRFDFIYADAGTDRLRLNAVQQAGQPPYTFQYESNNKIPARTSAAQDHWGFYNGRSNSSLIPAPPAEIANGRTSAQDAFATADRSTNPSVMQVGMLTEVHYPTGGSTSFTYEANQIGLFGVEDTESITTFTAATSSLRGDTTPSQLDPTSQAVYEQMFVPNDWPSIPSVGATVFTLPQGSSNLSIKPFYFQATSTKFQTFYELWRLPDGNPDPAAYRSGKQIYPVIPNSFGAILPSRLPAGTYLLFAATTELSDGATLEVKMHVNTGLPYTERAVGGLRIRRMADYGLLGDSLVSLYDYTYYDSLTQRRVSSGKLFFDPEYIQITGCNAAIITAADSRTLSYLQEGYHMGYSQVSVTHRGRSNGNTIYHYLNDKDANTRNLVTEEILTDEAGHLVKQLNNEYYYEQSAVIPLVKVKFKQYITHYLPPTENGDGYHFIEREVYETKTDAYRYFQQALPRYVRERNLSTAPAVQESPATYEVTRIYSYARAPTGQLFGSPAWVRQSLGNGEQLATHTMYARDFTIATAADAPAAGLAALATHQVLTAEVETQQWRHRGQDSVLIGGTLTHYDNLQPRRRWRLETAVPLSATTFTGSRIQNQRFLQDEHYKEAISYDLYDPVGNLQQVKRVADVPTVYLWGYANTLPVAQIQNATKAQVDAALSAFGLSATTLPTDEQLLRDACRNLRQRLPQARITSFTYRPLVGITSQTDPSGRTTTYEYDSLNRLLRVRDEQGRILTQQEYKYALQP